LTGSAVYLNNMFAIVYWSENAMESEATAIARALRRREPEILHVLVVQYQHRLLRYLVNLSGNRDLAEDLFQETWVRVVERGHQYNGRSAFCTWLYGIARNLVIDHMRRKSPVSLDELMQDEGWPAIDPAHTDPPMFELAARHQQAAHIREALSCLPIQFREAIVLRFQDELSLEEISALTTMPLGTVKSRLHRGLNMLIKLLREESP
jgi:RNA polymerase sigma-70 factor, ECF subfamily